MPNVDATISAAPPRPDPRQVGRTGPALQAFATRRTAHGAGRRFNIYVPKPSTLELAVSVANLAGRFPGG